VPDGGKLQATNVVAGSGDYRVVRQARLSAKSDMEPAVSRSVNTSSSLFCPADAVRNRDNERQRDSRLSNPNSRHENGGIIV
jgi:hypothetical protein